MAKLVSELDTMCPTCHRKNAELPSVLNRRQKIFADLLVKVVIRQSKLIAKRDNTIQGIIMAIDGAALEWTILEHRRNRILKWLGMPNQDGPRLRASAKKARQLMGRKYDFEFDLQNERIDFELERKNG